MTPVPGAGALPEMSGMPSSGEPDEPDEPDEPLAPPSSSLSCCAKGSLLANLLKEASCPSWTTVLPPTSASELPGVVLPGPDPPRVGAASVGVPVGGVEVVDVSVEADAGAGGLS